MLVVGDGVACSVIWFCIAEWLKGMFYGFAEFRLQCGDNCVCVSRRKFLDDGFSICAASSSQSMFDYL